MADAKAPTAEQFRRVMSSFVTGVTVVTTLDADDRPYGLTVNAFTSVSLNPLLILICLDNELSGISAFRSRGWFGVNILAEDQEHLSRFFATPGTRRDQDLYVGGPLGIPLLAGCLATMECKIREEHGAGDHSVFIGEVRSASLTSERSRKKPLTYFRGRYRRLLTGAGRKA